MITRFIPFIPYLILFLDLIDIFRNDQHTLTIKKIKKALYHNVTKSLNRIKYFVIYLKLQ